MQVTTTKRRLLMVLLSVALLSAGWLGLSGITLLFALIPLMAISEGYTDSRRDWWRMCGWASLTFILWSAATIWWVWIASPFGPITAGIVGSFWNLVAFMAYHYVSKRAPRALAYTLFVALWVTTEYLYNSAEVMTFPWLLLGHGFSNDIWAVQWYEYTGIFGGTLWALCSNVAIFEALRVCSKGSRVRAALIALLPILISIVILLTYNDKSERCVVSVIQPNVPCYEEERAAANMEDPTESLMELVAQIPNEATCVLLPESALAYLPQIGSFDESSTRYVAPILRKITALAPSDTEFIVGASTQCTYGNIAATETAHHDPGIGYYDRFNSALLVDNDGNINDIYHKGKLVIGVEAMPSFVSSFVDLGGITGQLGWGREPKIFDVGEMKIGPAICYEGLYGEHFAGFVKRGAEVMGVISNDGWWGDTPGHKRLFDFCRLRAIETRRAIARSANTGISGFISPTGNYIGKRLEWDERGILTASLPLNNELTTYTIYGDWIARIARLVALLTLLYYVAYRVRRRNHLVE